MIRAFIYEMKKFKLLLNLEGKNLIIFIFEGIHIKCSEKIDIKSIFCLDNFNY